MELNTNILLSIQSTQPAEQIFFFFLMYYLLTIQQMYFRRRNNTVAKISRVLANVPTMCYGNCLLLWNCCPFVFFGSGGREGEADKQCQRSHEGQQSPRRTVGGWGAGSPDPAQRLPLSKRRGRVLVRTKTKKQNAKNVVSVTVMLWKCGAEKQGGLPHAGMKEVLGSVWVLMSAIKISSASGFFHVFPMQFNVFNFY